MHYIGLDVDKQSIAFCIKTADGTLVDRGALEATRPALESWAAALPQPWQGAMEATPFSGWIHDTLSAHADDLAVAHPADLEAITKAKKKSDKIDAEKITDLLRVDLLPRVWMPPREWRQLRWLLRYRNRLIEQAVWHKEPHRDGADGARRTVCEVEASYQELFLSVSRQPGDGGGRRTAVVREPRPAGRV